MIDKEKFEKEGLKIDKERVLTYSELSCPFDCKYCFVEDINPDQKKNISYLSEKQFELIKQLPEEVDLIMLGCDTEFFQSKKDSFQILERLSDFNKDISVITKMQLSEDFIKKLKDIDIKLNQKGNFLTFSESIPCLESAKEWEPRASIPKARIETIKNAYKSDIKTLIAIRPLLPTVPNEELERIVDSTKDYCYGYYSGSLYLKSLEHPILKKEDFSKLKIEELQPHWMPKDNIFYKIEKEGQMEFLQEKLEKNNKPLFEGAAKGINYLRKL